MKDYLRTIFFFNVEWKNEGWKTYLLGFILVGKERRMKKDEEIVTKTFCFLFPQGCWSHHIFKVNKSAWRFIQYPFVSQSPPVPSSEALEKSTESFYNKGNSIFPGFPGLGSLSLPEDLRVALLAVSNENSGWGSDFPLPILAHTLL